MNTIKNFVIFIFLAVLAFLPAQFVPQAVAVAETQYAIPIESESVSSAATVYTVQPGDSFWKIAVRFEVGLKELITANSQIKNPALIYAGQKINIPSVAPLKSIEDEVLRLINIERSRNGLQTLTSNWQAARVARIKSQDMINNGYFSHISPVYGSPFKMMES
ncbi:MAG TPA: SafA/ExsA family spore coat assembly protein, partial [Clostridia bacterium]|nr:SafA/ExsA family spore coat assembly protein [Clostridia bacterium]